MKNYRRTLATLALLMLLNGCAANTHTIETEPTTTVTTDPAVQPPTGESRAAETEETNPARESVEETEEASVTQPTTPAVTEPKEPENNPERNDTSETQQAETEETESPETSLDETDQGSTEQPAAVPEETLPPETEREEADQDQTEPPETEVPEETEATEPEVTEYSYWRADNSVEIYVDGELKATVEDAVFLNNECMGGATQSCVWLMHQCLSAGTTKMTVTNTAVYVPGYTSITQEITQDVISEMVGNVEEVRYDITHNMHIQQTIEIETMPEGTYTYNGTSTAGGYSFYLGDRTDGDYNNNKSLHGTIINTGDQNLTLFVADNSAAGYTAVDLGRKIGDKFVLGTQWNTDESLDIYVDGIYKTTIENVTRSVPGANNNLVLSYNRASDLSDAIKLTISNVVIHNKIPVSIADELGMDSYFEAMNWNAVRNDITLPTFNAVNSEGTPYSYVGTWKKGLYNGYGVCHWEADDVYTQKGTFVDGEFSPTPVEFFVSKGTYPDESYTITNNALTFLEKYPQIFTDNNVSNTEIEYEQNFQYKAFEKNPKKYGSKLIVVPSLRVVQIFENDYWGYEHTFIIAQDGSGNVYYVNLFGYWENIYEGSYIKLTALPLDYFTYPNVYGDKIWAIACAGVRIN